MRSTSPVRFPASPSPLRTLARGARLVASTALICAALFATLVAFEFAWRQEAEVISGVPRIVDGDTLVIDGVNVRLAGLDAPQRAQQCTDAGGDAFACGRAATDYLTFLVDGGEATCRGHGRDRWDRLIGTCRAGGVDLSEAMIRRGWAVAYLGDLEAVEMEARERGVGLWAGQFQRPDEWRRERRRAGIGVPFAAIRDAARSIAAGLRGEARASAPDGG